MNRSNSDRLHLGFSCGKWVKAISMPKAGTAKSYQSGCDTCNAEAVFSFEFVPINRRQIRSLIWWNGSKAVCVGVLSGCGTTKGIVPQLSRSGLQLDSPWKWPGPGPVEMAKDQPRLRLVQVLMCLSKEKSAFGGRTKGRAIKL
jgi:hypothetical protein